MTPPSPPILHFHEPSRRYYHASPTTSIYSSKPLKLY
jgi:hypothetical protein